MTSVTVYNATNLLATIATLNAYTGPHTITMDGTDADYVVRYSCADMFGKLAFPIVFQDITIDGQGLAITRAVDAPEKFRFFGVDAKNPSTYGKLTLQNLRLFNGDSDDAGGGAIVNDGQLILSNCHLSGNVSDTYGGAIYAGDYKPVTISDSSFTNNMAVGSNARGGAIYGSSSSTLTITDSTFFSNHVKGAGSRGSAIATFNSATTTISDSNIMCNSVLESTYNEAIIAAYSFDADDNNWWGHDSGPNGNGYTGSGQAITGAVSASTPAGSPLSIPVVIWYNRYGVANYGIDRSRDNFAYFPADDGDQRELPVSIPDNSIVKAYGSVGGPYYYPFVDHVSGGNGTGSAVFISELMHLGGGLPMIIRTYNEDDCALEGGSWQEIGWRVCCNDNQIYNSATGSWKGHLGIVGFFGTFEETVPFNDLVGWVPPVGETDGYQTLLALGTIGAGTYIDEEGFKDYVYPLFDDGILANVQTGDYVFLSDETHGLLIVGWGPAEEVPNALNAQTSTSETNVQISINRTLDEYENRTLQVPYVVDFCYGYTLSDFPDDKTRWLQDCRPRPFYATAASIAGGALDKDPDNEAYYGLSISEYTKRLGGQFARFGDNPNWNFYRFPDSITVYANELYCSHPCKFVEPEE